MRSVFHFIVVSVILLIPTFGLTQTADEDFEKASERVARAAEFQSKKLIFYSRNSLSSLLSLERLPPEISQLESLRVLKARHTQLSDVSPLSNLTGLESVDLKLTKLNSLQPFSNLHNLRHLNVSGTNVSDLSPLSSLSSIETLYLADTAISDISALSNLSELKILDISGTKVTDISVLAGMPQLERLSIGDTDIRDLSALRGLQNLTKISLRNSRVESLEDLSHIDGLEIYPPDFQPSGKSDVELCLEGDDADKCINTAIAVGVTNEPDIEVYTKLAHRACDLSAAGCFFLATDLKFGVVLEEDSAKALEIFTELCSRSPDHGPSVQKACEQAEELSNSSQTCDPTIDYLASQEGQPLRTTGDYVGLDIRELFEEEDFIDRIDWERKNIFIFWATWDSITEKDLFPLVDANSQKAALEDFSFVPIAIPLNAPEGLINALLPFDVFLPFHQNPIEMSKSANRSLRIQWWPTSFVVDGNGVVIASAIGTHFWENELADCALSQVFGISSD